MHTNFHVSTKQAHASQKKSPTPYNNTRLPTDSCSKISQDDRLMWMKLSKESKALTL